MAYSLYRGWPIAAKVLLQIFCAPGSGKPRENLGKALVVAGHPGQAVLDHQNTAVSLLLLLGEMRGLDLGKWLFWK
jgi:hypothetical protein